MRSILRLVTPPFLWNALQAIRDRTVNREQPRIDSTGMERKAEWYDKNLPDHFLRHYSKTRYYCFWTVIVDRMLRTNIKSVLDIGCGTGQFAALLRDKGFTNYHGLDFSSKRVEYAQAIVPEFSFSVADVFTTNLFQSFDYDAVVCTEVLEHINRDTDVILRLRQGTRFYGSVPNFPSASHVRYFSTCLEVEKRYKEYFAEFTVTPFVVDNHVFFVLEGVKT